MNSDGLSSSDISPFPLAIETNYTDAGWRVNLIVLLDVTGGGYESVNLTHYAQPYELGPNGDPDLSPNAAAAAKRAALESFATHLRHLFTHMPDLN